MCDEDNAQHLLSTERGPGLALYKYESLCCSQQPYEWVWVLSPFTEEAAEAEC